MMQNRCIKKTSSPLVFHCGPSTLASYWHFMSIPSIPIHLFSKQLLPNAGLLPQKWVPQQIPIPKRPPQLLLCFHWRKLHLKKVSKIRSKWWLLPLRRDIPEAWWYISYKHQTYKVIVQAKVRRSTSMTRCIAKLYQWFGNVLYSNQLLDAFFHFLFMSRVDL